MFSHLFAFGAKPGNGRSKCKAGNYFLVPAPYNGLTRRRNEEEPGDEKLDLAASKRWKEGETEEAKYDKKEVKMNAQEQWRAHDLVLFSELLPVIDQINGKKDVGIWVRNSMPGARCGVWWWR